MAVVEVGLLKAGFDQHTKDGKQRTAIGVYLALDHLGAFPLAWLIIRVVSYMSGL
jgi:hypothetical protein